VCGGVIDARRDRVAIPLSRERAPVHDVCEAYRPALEAIAAARDAVARERGAGARFG
jgi:hypothetical protein